MEKTPLIAKIAARTSIKPKELERFIKFAIVGAIGAVVDFTVLNIMKILFERMGLGVGWRMGLDAQQIQLIAANAISFSTAVISNFTWNRLWTFPESRQYPIGSQLAQFAVVNVIGLVINTFILVTTDSYFFSHFFSHRLSYNLAKALAIAVVLFWNFGVNRVWTYKDIE